MQKDPRKLPEDKRDLDSAMDWIYRNALGNIIEASATPTSATMKAGQFYYYSSKIYYKTNKGTAFSIDVTTL